MGILLAFAPFVVFAILDRIVGVLPGLAAGAAVSAVLVARDRIRGARSWKVLEVGTFGLFAGLAVYTAISGREQSVFGVRLLVDGGLLLIVLASIALRRPFTLQYARENSPAEIWNEPGFVQANYVITAAWAAAFALLVIADLMMVYDASIPRKFGILLTVAVLVGAAKFTSWYPEHRSARQGVA